MFFMYRRAGKSNASHMPVYQYTRAGPKAAKSHNMTHESSILKSLSESRNEVFVDRTWATVSTCAFRLDTAAVVSRGEMQEHRTRGLRNRCRGGVLTVTNRTDRSTRSTSRYRVGGGKTLVTTSGVSRKTLTIKPPTSLSWKVELIPTILAP